MAGIAYFNNNFAYVRCPWSHHWAVCEKEKSVHIMFHSAFLNFQLYLKRKGFLWLRKQQHLIVCSHAVWNLSLKMHKSLTIATFNAACTWWGGFRTQGIIYRQLHWKIVVSRNILGHVIDHTMRNEGHLWSVLSQHDWTVWSLAYFMETVWMSHWIWSPMSGKKKKKLFVFFCVSGATVQHLQMESRPWM